MNAHQTIQDFLKGLKSYHAEGLKILSEISLKSPEELLLDDSERIMNRLISIWQQCDQKMVLANFHELSFHPQYAELKCEISKVLGVVAQVMKILEERKVQIQKILEELPRPMMIAESRAESIFEDSV